MRKPLCGGGAQALKHRRALAAIALAMEDAQPGMIWQARRAAIGAAIDDDPDRLPMTQRLRNGFAQSSAGIVARDKNEMGGRGHGTRSWPRAAACWPWRYAVCRPRGTAGE